MFLGVWGYGPGRIVGSRMRGTCKDGPSVQSFAFSEGQNSARFLNYTETNVRAVWGVTARKPWAATQELQRLARVQANGRSEGAKVENRGRSGSGAPRGECRRKSSKNPLSKGTKFCPIFKFYVFGISSISRPKSRWLGPPGPPNQDFGLKCWLGVVSFLL